MAANTLPCPAPDSLFLCCRRLVPDADSPLTIIMSTDMHPTRTTFPLHWPFAWPASAPFNRRWPPRPAWTTSAPAPTASSCCRWTRQPSGQHARVQPLLQPLQGHEAQHQLARRQGAECRNRIHGGHSAPRLPQPGAGVWRPAGRLHRAAVAEAGSLGVRLAATPAKAWATPPSRRSFSGTWART